MKSPHNCDACQGAKKKCDELSPSCTRCTRLNISCTGRGQTRYRFKEHFANSPYRQTNQSKSSTGVRRQQTESPPVRLGVVSVSPPQTRRSSASPDEGQQAVTGNSTEFLARRFSAALKVDDPKFDLSGLVAWLVHVPERLGADDLLDKAALAFLDAYDCLQSDGKTVTAPPTYDAAMVSLESALQNQEQINSPNSLAAVFMLNMAQKWTLNSAWHYMNHMNCTCQLLNDTVDENWSDSFGRSVRLSLIQIVCIESIINPSLAVDSRCLQDLKYEPDPYLPLYEENGQVIESLDLPFLLRLSQLLRTPEEHHEEIRKSYVRLQTEWPFTRRRYQSLAGISKIAGINRSSLIHPEVQLGIAHTITLGISLVLNANLVAMDPANISLHIDGLEIGREAVDISRKLLQELPKGVWFTPVALFASLIATEDPDIADNFSLTAKEHSCYWTEPAYTRPAKTLKKQILRLRAKTLMTHRSGEFLGLRECGAYPPHVQGNHGHGPLSVFTPPESSHQSLGMDSRASAFSGQWSPLSDVGLWDLNL